MKGFKKLYLHSKLTKLFSVNFLDNIKYYYVLEGALEELGRQVNSIYMLKLSELKHYYLIIRILKKKKKSFKVDTCRISFLNWRIHMYT